MAPALDDSRSFEVGTRKSKLALVQTDAVVKALNKAWPDYDFKIRARDTAAGDIDKVTAFKDMPVKNLWTHDLEQSLVEEELDLLVHSLKGKLDNLAVSAPTYGKRCPYTATAKLWAWSNHEA